MHDRPRRSPILGFRLLSVLELHITVFKSFYLGPERVVVQPASASEIVDLWARAGLSNGETECDETARRGQLPGLRESAADAAEVLKASSKHCQNWYSRNSASSIQATMICSNKSTLAVL